MISGSTVEQAATNPRELPVAIKNSIGPKDMQQQKKHQERCSTSDDNVVGPDCDGISQPVPKSGPQPKTKNVASTEATAKALHDSEHGTDCNEPHAVSPDNMDSRFFAEAGSGGGHVPPVACLFECSSSQRSEPPASGGKASTNDTSVASGTKEIAQSKDETRYLSMGKANLSFPELLAATRDPDPVIAAAAAAAAVAAATAMSSLEQKGFAPHFEKQGFTPHRWRTPATVTSSTVAASSCTGVDSISSSSPPTMCVSMSTPTWNPSQQQLSQASTATAAATTAVEVVAGAAVAGTSFAPARAGEVSRSSAILSAPVASPSPWHVSYPNVGNVPAQGTSPTPSATQALPPPVACLPSRPGSPEADSSSRPTPSAHWLVQEALSVKEAVDAAVRGAGYSSSDDVKAVGEGGSGGDESRPWSDRSQGDASGSVTSFSFSDDAVAEIPRVMADLRAALGRGGMSSSEAKAWVEALDRLGEGLDRDKLRKDYPDVSRGVQTPESTSCLSTSSAADTSALTVSWEKPPRVVPSDPEPDPGIATTGIRRQSQDFSSREALVSPMVSGDVVDQSSLLPPPLLDGGESVAGGAVEGGQDAAPLPDPGMKKCEDDVNSDDVINNSSGISNNDVIVKDASNHDDVNTSGLNNLGVSSSDFSSSSSSSSKGFSKGKSRNAAERRSKKQSTQGDGVTSPAPAAAVFVSSRTRRSGGVRTRSSNERQTTRSEESSPSSLLKASVTVTTVTTRSESAAKGNRERAAATTAVERKNSATAGTGGGVVKQRERRNASKFSDDVIVKIPCLCADLNAALGRNVLLPEVKDCLRALDGKGEGLHRQALLEACLELLRRKPKRETHPARQPVLKQDDLTDREEKKSLTPNALRNRYPAKSSTTSKTVASVTEKTPTESPAESPIDPPANSPTESMKEPPTGSKAVKEAFSRRKKRSRSCAGQSSVDSNEDDDAGSVNNNGAGSSGSGGSSCRNRGGGGGRAAVGAPRPEEKEGVADSPAAPAAVASRKVTRDSVGRHMVVPRRSRGLLPESVIAKVPRLLVDMAGVLGYCVSANEAKAQCRELERCGEGLTSKELCDACVCLLLRRANRNLIRTRGRVIVKSSNRSKNINRSSSSSGNKSSSRSNDAGRIVKQEKKKDAAEVLDKGQRGGELKEETPARSSVSETEELAASRPSEKRCDAKEEVVQEAVLEGKAELVEAVALSEAGSGEVLGVEEVGDERVKKKPRRAVGKLPESVVAKLPGLVLDLETFVGRPVSVEEVEERCRQLDRGGEGLTHQELCDACVSLLLRIDDQNLIGSGESVHISLPGSVTEKQPSGGGRVVGDVQDRGEFASSPEGSRISPLPVPLATYSMFTGPNGNVAPLNLQNQRGDCDIPPDRSGPLLDYRQASSDSSLPKQDAGKAQDSSNSMHVRQPLEIEGEGHGDNFLIESESSASETDEDSDGCTENRELDDDVIVSSSRWSKGGGRDVDGVDVNSDVRLPVQSRMEPSDEGDSGKIAVVKAASATIIGSSHTDCLHDDVRVAAVEAGIDNGSRDDRRRDIVAGEVDGQSHELLQGEVGDFAVFPAPSGSSVPFLVGKILEKRSVSLNRSEHDQRRSSEEGGDQASRTEVLVHWFTLKKNTTTRTRTMTKVGPNDIIGSGDGVVVESKGEVPSKSVVGAVVSSYVVGGWAPVYVPCPRSKRLKRDTGVECLAAAILVFPRLLSSDALPASVREVLKYAVVKKATTAASRFEGRDGSGVGDACGSSGSAGETNIVERKKSILDRCDDSDFEDGTF